MLDIVVHSPALEGNRPGDPADRDVTVYLPPGYYASAQRYPVIYLLHAYANNNGYYREFVPVFDTLVEEQELPPAILVLPNADNSYGGSWYTNSPATGNWEDFIARDLVRHVDSTYRTVASAAGRAVAGQSMGGFGAIRLAMRNPGIFGATYSTNGPMSFAGDDNLLGAGALGRSLTAALTTTLGRSPSSAEKLEAAPLGMVEEFAGNLAQLRGIGFLAGVQDAATLNNAQAFSTALDAAGIAHSYIEHAGGHTDYDDHLETIVMPFLAERLDSESLPAHLPRLVSFTPAAVATAVGLTVPLDIDLELDPDQIAATDRLTLDLSALGMDEAVSLEAAGAGRFTAHLTLSPTSGGHYDLPVRWESGGGESRVLLNIALKAWPATDLTVLDEGLDPGWQIAPYRVEVTDLTQTAVVRAGSAAGAFQVQGGFAGWKITLSPETPVRTLGYTTLRFAFHPEAVVPGSNPSFMLLLEPGNRVNLLDLSQLDLTREEWQQVELPLKALELNGPITSMRLDGNFGGTVYLDDVRLVADAAPEVATAVSEAQTSAQPEALALGQNYPNPFNSSTTIRFELARQELVNLDVRNLAGQRVATLASGHWEAGAHTLSWDGRDDGGREAASGLYMYRLQAGDQVETRRLLLLK